MKLQILRRYKVYKSLVIFFWFIVLPFFLSFLLFVYKAEIPIQAIQRDEEGRSKYVVSTDKFNEPGIKNTIRKIFQSPLDLSYYRVCIKNISQLTNTSTSEIVPIDLHLQLKTKEGSILKDWDMTGGKENCDSFKISNNTFYYEYKVNKQQIPASSILTETGQCKPVSLALDFNFTDAKPLLSDQIALVLIFHIAYWGFVMLLISIYQHCKDYFSSQRSQQQ